MTNQLSPEEYCKINARIIEEAYNNPKNEVMLWCDEINAQREQAVTEALPELIALRLDNERMRKALEDYRYAQRRMLEKWADGDQNVKNECWNRLHNCEFKADDALFNRTPAPVAEEVIRLAQIALSLNQHDDYKGYGIYRRARSEASKTSPVTRQALEAWRGE